MAGKAVAVDPGSYGWKVLALREGKSGIAITRFGAAPTKNDSVDLAAFGVPLGGCVAGLAGKDMTLRYTQVPPSPDWQLRNLMDLEIQDIAGQSGGELSADYNLLPAGDEDADMDTILLALARNDALEKVSDVIGEAQGSVACHIPNCIALYNAYLRTAVIEDDEQVVCLANIGHETTDIALVKGQDLLFARNLTGGGKVLDDAIAAAFDVSARKAETLKRDLIDLDPQSRGRYASGQAEKVTMAAGGAAGVFASGIQSSVAFCQSQTKIEGLRLDRVLLSGGGARLRGLRGMLRETLHCPVEIFDPFETVDLSVLPEADAEQLSELRSEAVIALGLAVSRIDSEVYSLEILPEAVKRRQRFMQRTIYNIAAALLVALLLAMTAVQDKKALAAEQVKHDRLLSKKRRVESLDRTTQEIVDENNVSVEVAEVLSEKAIPLNGVLRTMRVVRDTLPPEMWITKLALERAKRRPGMARPHSRPVVVLEGAGRPIHGVAIGRVYRDFFAAFKDHELMKRCDVSPVSDEDLRENKTTFTFTIDFLPDPPPDAEGDENGKGGE